jgi:fructose-bisphosphate aldolase class I
MNTAALTQTVRDMLSEGKGLLAMDESTATCNRRFASAGIAQTPEMRRAWRELLLTTPGLGDCISGAILFDETLRQSAADGRPFVEIARAAGIVPGIKVDLGSHPLAAHPGEEVTHGLDSLREQLQASAEAGARFAKWRAVFSIGDAADGADEGRRIPSAGGLEANAHALARYAALCQEAGLVPIVEPEVLMTGSHSRERCLEVSQRVLHCVFAQLNQQRVQLEAMVLKPNMVTAGLGCAHQDTADEVADASLQCLLRSVPAAVPAVAFLSGGQSGEQASQRLNAMHRHLPPRPARALPWRLTFSFARALQHPALDIWGGIEAHRGAAQQALLHRARCNCAALKGEYHTEMEA